MPRVARLGLVALVGVAGAFVALSAAYATSMARASGEVAPRVSIVGVRVGGLDGKPLDNAIDQVAKKYEGAKVVVKAEKGGFETTTTELGVGVDRAGTEAAARQFGRTGTYPSRVVGWLKSFVIRRSSPVVVTVERSKAYAVVAAKDKLHTAAVEPGLGLDDGKLAVVAGKAGKGINPSDVTARVIKAARTGVPIKVEVKRGTVPPRYREADAQKLIAEARSRIAEPITVVAGEDRTTVPDATLRSWVTSRVGPNGLELTFDPERSTAGLMALLPDAGTKAVETSFRVAGGGVELVAGKAGTACCDTTAAAALNAEVLEDGATGPVELPLRTVQPQRTIEQAKELGIKQQISTFTTKHACCQPRVTNIHRIADLVQGQIIEPGQTFSVNTFIGKRTIEKGFVVDHVIEDGRFAEAVGGGISQFATTFFNAAFFGGLDIVEYQSHSIYISRYPYGREATLSFPKPDLRVKNTSQHGILIWPTYTGTTLTVSFYSTKWAEVTQTGQTKEPRGQSCTRVRTERTIKRLSDDKETKDSVSALYRGAEGLNCDQPLSASTTTTQPGATTTTTAPPSSSTTAPPR